MMRRPRNSDVPVGQKRLLCATGLEPEASLPVLVHLLASPKDGDSLKRPQPPPRRRVVALCGLIERHRNDSVHDAGHNPPAGNFGLRRVRAKDGTHIAILQMIFWVTSDVQRLKHVNRVNRLVRHLLNNRLAGHRRAAAQDRRKQTHGEQRRQPHLSLIAHPRPLGQADKPRRGYAFMRTQSPRTPPHRESRNDRLGDTFLDRGPVPRRLRRGAAAAYPRAARGATEGEPGGARGDDAAPSRGRSPATPDDRVGGG
jgi:hypothetical protein